MAYEIIEELHQSRVPLTLISFLVAPNQMKIPTHEDWKMLISAKLLNFLKKVNRQVVLGWTIDVNNLEPMIRSSVPN